MVSLKEYLLKLYHIVKFLNLSFVLQYEDPNFTVKKIMGLMNVFCQTIPNIIFSSMFLSLSGKASSVFCLQGP